MIVSKLILSFRVLKVLKLSKHFVEMILTHFKGWLFSRFSSVSSLPRVSSSVTSLIFMSSTGWSSGKISLKRRITSWKCQDNKCRKICRKSEIKARTNSFMALQLQSHMLNCKDDVMHCFALCECKSAKTGKLFWWVVKLTMEPHGYQEAKFTQITLSDANGASWYNTCHSFIWLIFIWTLK